MGGLKNSQTYFSSSHFRNLECHSLTSLTSKGCQWPRKEVKEKKLGWKMTLNVEVITIWTLRKLIHPRGHMWPLWPLWVNPFQLSYNLWKYYTPILTFHAYTSTYISHSTFHVVIGCAKHSRAKLRYQLLVNRQE
jgi:hypothetical protein